MSLFTLALAAEFADHGVAVNALWPRTAIATAAVLHELGGEDMMSGTRKPEIVADAAHAILTLPARRWTGRFSMTMKYCWRRASATSLRTLVTRVALAPTSSPSRSPG